MVKSHLVYCFDEKDRLNFIFIKAQSFKKAITIAYRMGYTLCTDYQHAQKHLKLIERRKLKEVNNDELE